MSSDYGSARNGVNSQFPIPAPKAQYVSKKQSPTKQVLEDWDKGVVEEIDVTKGITENYRKIVPYPLGGKRYPVPMRWHSSNVINHILGHNSRTQFTGVTICGMSGSGKTTLVKQMLHTIHTKHRDWGMYQVHWWSGEDLEDMDSKIDNLAKGVNHIMVFDDASYALESVDKRKVSALMAKLTTIRHIVGAKVISIMMIHYSKAMFKFFRAVPFFIYTSINAEETGNYMDLYKGKSHVVSHFARQYNNMMLKGYFDTNVSSYNGKTLRYKTDKPFRLAMVEEEADLHFMLYAKQECKECTMGEKWGDAEMLEDGLDGSGKLDSQKVVNLLVYGKKDEERRPVTANNMASRWTRALEWYGYFVGGVSTLPKTTTTLVKQLNKLNSEYQVDWKEVLDILRGEKKRVRERAEVEKMDPDYRPTKYADNSKYTKNKRGMGKTITDIMQELEVEKDLAEKKKFKALEAARPGENPPKYKNKGWAEKYKGDQSKKAISDYAQPEEAAKREKNKTKVQDQVDALADEFG